MLNNASSGLPDEGKEFGPWPVLKCTGRITRVTVPSPRPLLEAGQRYWLAVSGAADESLVIWYMKTNDEDKEKKSLLVNNGGMGWTHPERTTRPSFAVYGLLR